MPNQTEYKEYFADCYVLSENRSEKFIQLFLDKFIPNRKELSNEYEIPQYSDNPIITFNNATCLIDYLTAYKNVKHIIYWKNNEKSKLKGAMCFFTEDNQVIFGIYCNTAFPDKSIESDYLNKLKEFCNSNIGYFTYEEPAPDNVSDFLKRAYYFQSNPAQ